MNGCSLEFIQLEERLTDLCLHLKGPIAIRLLERLPRRRGAFISAIFASTALSASACEARSASAFTSWARCFIAARSSSVNPWLFLLGAFLSSVGMEVSFLLRM